MIVLFFSLEESKENPSNHYQYGSRQYPSGNLEIVSSNLFKGDIQRKIPKPFNQIFRVQSQSEPEQK